LLQVEGLVYLEADIGGTTIRLYDSNLNGCFGDVAESGGRQVKDQMQIGAAGASRSLCQYILLGETLHEIELVSGGEALRVQPYTGPVATLTPAFPAGWQAHLALTHVESGFEASASAGKKTMLPPGAYLLRARDCQSGDAADVRKREVRLFSRFALSRASKFFVTPGENTVAFGPPFKLGFDAVRSTEYEDLVTVRDVWLIGAAGECYDAYNAGENAENTHTCFVRAGGREQQIGTMRYG
jgi:hypothetical protein